MENNRESTRRNNFSFLLQTRLRWKLRVPAFFRNYVPGKTWRASLLKARSSNLFLCTTNPSNKSQDGSFMGRPAERPPMAPLTPGCQVPKLCVTRWVHRSWDSGATNPWIHGRLEEATLLSGPLGKQRLAHKHSRGQFMVRAGKSQRRHLIS